MLHRNPKKLIAQALCAAIVLLSARAYGWDSVGHMVVAGLAYDELTEVQQSQLVAILKQHPRVNFILEGFPDGNPEDRDFAMAAATWPDLARGKTSKKTPAKDFIKNNGYEESSPAVEKVDYHDGLLHPGWHFIDTPVPAEGGQLPADHPSTPAVNAVGVVNVLMRQLQSGEDDQEKAYDLAWLMHLVGDLHQPLHAVNGISDTLPKGDRGGNLVFITGATQSAPELHAFWDNVLGRSASSDRKTHKPRLDKDAAVADEVIGTVQRLHLPKRNSEDKDPNDWVAESVKLAERDTYDLQLEPTTIERPGKEPTDALTAELDDKYDTTAKRDAQRQVRLAGHRLALLLQEVLQ